jgi:uncharacterized protein
MQLGQAAKILRILISESDRYQGKPLYEEIVAKCRELKIAGATVFLGLEGYGETAEMHRAHLVHRDRPMVITIIDTAENIRRLVPAVEAMMGTGVMATSEVRMIRVEKAGAARH